MASQASISESGYTPARMYGNIAARQRVQFTVIGKAANEAFRMETILVSARFARALPLPW